ncbi:MAG: MetQ/NlpA family ABC transporter substrate-binding protein [Bifidobacteriaceae bacterium]|nr:MetQ/NlpA family ABC transporter substrate-binding protein [Bifidobacteriaceae bacterium]
MAAVQKKKHIKNLGSIIGLTIAVVAVIAALVAGHIAYDKPTTNAKTTIVKIGIVSENDNLVWDEVNKILAQRGDNIKVVTTQFQGGSGLANQATVSGDLDLNAFQSHNFLAAQVAEKHYALTAIGDLYISRFDIYSKQYKSVKDLPDGAKIAIPNNPANGGRALLILQEAGLIGTTTQKGENYPTTKEITSNPHHYDIEEVDANEIPNLLDDYAVGVTNGYSAMDHGLDPKKDAVFDPKLDINGKDHQWVNTLVARTEDKNNPVYKKILSAYRTKKVAQVFSKNFSTAYEVAFDY